MAALDGLGFANYAIGMAERGKDFVFQQAERARAQLEREKMDRLREEARARNERVFANLGGGDVPQMGLGQSQQQMPQQPPQAPQMAQGRGGLAAMLGQVGQKYGLPGGYLERTAQIESAMNPSARNPRSSAKGLFQFIDGTAKEYGLSNPMDPAASADAAARYAQNSARILKAALGRDPSPGELYLAHQQGAGTAVRLLRNPNAPVTQVMGRQAIMLNGGTPNMTAGQFAQKWLSKFGNAGQPQGVQMASAGPMQLPQAPQMQQQAQAPQFAPQQPQAQMPGANIPTEQLIAVLRDPGSSDEDKKIAAMLLEPRFADPVAQDFKRAQIAQMQRETALMGQPKPQELPSDVREYQFAQSQGYTGSFTDWQLQNRRAGATSVNIGAEGDKAFEKNLAEGLAKSFTGLMDQAREAAPQLMDIGILREALQNSPQGLQGGLASIAQSFGVDVTGKGAVQVADAIVAKLVPAQRPPGSGPMSDRDVLLFRSSLPSLWGSPQGNKIIVDAMESMVRYKIQAGQIAERVALGQATREQALQELRSLPDPLANFKALRGQNQRAGQTSTGIQWGVEP